MRVALHVEQGHFADDRAEQLRIQRQHIAHQQAAIAAALGAEVRARSDAAREQIFSNGGEVFVRAQTIRLQRSLVPARPEFAAAADVGDHVDAAALQP